jgi:hypothetical protein
MHMIFLWIVFAGCTVAAGLIGYGMGYLRGARDAITTDPTEPDLGFSGDGNGEH